MGKPLWTFEGFCTEAGGKPVQDWYYRELTVDERDLLRDRIRYLENLERHLWKLPCFGPAGEELWEIRRDTANGWLRIYGFFHPDKRRCFVLLNGKDKNVRNDLKGKRVARERLKLLKQKKGTTHEFSFEERTSRENPT